MYRSKQEKLDKSATIQDRFIDALDELIDCQVEAGMTPVEAARETRKLEGQYYATKFNMRPPRVVESIEEMEKLDEEATCIE